MFDRVGKTDPVTRGIEITVNYLGIQFDVSPKNAFHLRSHKSRCTPCCKNDYRSVISSVSAVSVVIIAF